MSTPSSHGTNPTYGAPRIRLKGKAHVDASISKSAEVRVVSGTVTDDAFRPASATVVLTIARASGTAAAAPGIPVVLATAIAPGAACSDDQHPVLETSTRLALSTNGSGRFCVRFRLPPDRYVARIAVRATPLLDEDVHDLPFDSSRDDLTLRFQSDPLVMALEPDESAVEVDALSEQSRGAIPAAGLLLELADEWGTLLGEATTDAFGQALFHIPSARLGQPGMGSMHATFAGNGAYGPCRRDVVVEKRTRVRLAVPDAKLDGTLSPARPEEGVALRVLATRAAARRGQSAPTGIVEALVGNAVVGAGMLVQGEARFVATFGTTGLGPVPMTLRYVADAPWFQPEAELRVVLPVRGPSLWTRLATILAGAAALAWFMGTRLPRWSLPSRPRKRRGDAPSAGTLIQGGARVGGWHGRVLDAHDGAPVGGAIVRIERPTFRGSDLLARTVSDAEGQFVLPDVSVLPSDRLVAEGLLHAPHPQTVPPSGEIAVALVLRRRALIDRLILWAGRHRGPFEGRPEPTPSEVADAARGESRVVHWARQVEEAAFGAAPVDSKRQAEVDGLAPHQGDPDNVSPDAGARSVRPPDRAR